METIPQDQQKNYDIFRDCLSIALIEKLSQPQPTSKRRSKSKKPHSTATPTASESAAETFQALPEELKTLDYYAYAEDADLRARCFRAPTHGLRRAGPRRGV
ncbi:hypothetical protein F4820DRAFT_159787 [Hypoxylon rubiginosum]|uniref:Uncharacterized protein n=1 Tax=Hypoxylon rubiginosum TaxID=110542 RepID=A0ACB9YJU1_9PEZI|nr:hypothetical protein F4820DRAFT_159787 [Hypoxylon rubiginosum]